MQTPKIRVTCKRIIENIRHRLRGLSLVPLGAGPAPSLLFRMKRPGASLFLTSTLRLRQHLSALLSVRNTFISWHFLLPKFCARLRAGHDVQEAEEGQLQRAGDRTRVSGHLFPLV